jgi:hypothetical protein
MTSIAYAVLPEIGLISIEESQYNKHIIERFCYAIKEKQKRDAIFYAFRSGRIRNAFAYLQQKKIERIKRLKKNVSYIALQHKSC